MANAVSIHIGINRVNPSHYGGWSGTLSSCENDATVMRDISAQAGFRSQMLLTADATRSNVSNAILRQARDLRSGDTLLITYAGHGGQVPDPTGEETDFADETWCLFDGQQLDDERYALWRQFQSGVRIIVVCDSCHSETATRAYFLNDYAEGKRPSRDPELVSRAMPPDVMLNTYRANASEYDSIPRGEKAVFGCGVLSLSACLDNQESVGNAFNGLFTIAVRRAWNEGNAAPGYPQFVQQINALVPSEVRETQEATVRLLGNCPPSFVNGQIFAH